ncbi:MAG TPA: hypothetical protein VG649_20685, partial [Candidatus Angelobacter sp.]|nr:hypothetical protein [Candidatus Angelobacter sp.]
RHVQAGSETITAWVKAHSILELSQRSGIPYTTCHRIVNDRLQRSSVALRDFFALMQVVAGDTVKAG